MTRKFIDTGTRTTEPENRCLNGQLVSKYALLVLLLIVLSVVGSTIPAADATASESNSQDSDVPLATFEINYHLPGASTVYMLWGVNDWMHVPEHWRPAGTSLYQDLMYTPMSGGSGIFTTSLTLPVNTRINYVFQITKRDNVSRADFWDTNNGENYFSVVHGNGSEKIAPKSLDAIAAQQESSLSKVMILLGLLVVLFAVHKLLAVFLPVPDRNDHNTPVIRVIGICIALLLILLPLRVLTVDYKFTNTDQLIWDVPYFLQAGGQDVLLVTILLSISLGFLWIFNKYTFIYRRIPQLVLVIASVAILFSIINTRVLPLIGNPLNYQWLYYSGFLNSFDAKHAIVANVDAGFIIGIFVIILLFLVIARLIEQLISPVFQFRFLKNHTAAFIVLLPLMVYSGALLISDDSKWDRVKLENPLISFVSSIKNSESNPFLFRMQTPVGAEEFRTVGERGDQQAGSAFNSDGVIRNVVILVLESVGARYLDAYGGNYGATPHLDSYRNQSLLFSNIYAHAPVTNKAMFSILASAYPWISYRSVSQEFTDINIPTLMGELDLAGYSTAFFSSADLRFQNADKFLEGKGFDLLQDYRSRKCTDPIFIASSKEWKYLDSSNDQCTSRAFSEWLPTVADSSFFAMIWTNNTHYPYFVTGETSDFGVDDVSFNLYLNALHESDKALEAVMRSLEDQGLTQSTLVIVVGDHGEAFGQHDQVVHASKIYDENLHVPLLLINPQLYSGGTNDKLGGLIDLAPTIMQVLGLQSADEWLGKSLLSKEQTPRIYFFAPWSELLFGYRESDSKFIYNASTGTFELFDLQTDPLEEHNIAAQNPEQRQQRINQLAAWVQFQDRYIKTLSSRKTKE